MRSHVALAVVVCALLSPLATTAAVPADATQSGFESGGVVIDVQLQPSGDARWNVSTTYRLNSTVQREAFDRLGEEFERGEGSVGFQVADFRALAEAAADRTGRSMQVVAVNRSATVRNRSGNLTGVLSLRFTWTNFARVSGDRVIVEDVFTSGMFSHLTRDQRLRIRAPQNYGALTMNPPPSRAVRNGTLVWEGPRTFEPDEPSVVFLEGIATTTTPGPDGPFDGENSLVLAVVGALVAGGLVAYVLARETSSFDGGPDDEPAAADADRPGRDDAPDSGGEPTRADRPPPDGPAGPEGEPGEPPDEEGPEPPDDDVDVELLSDEERVERLLRGNGGRMKQADIVKETGWSNAKVSQLLSSMDEESRIEKLRIGRENLITLVDGEADGD